MSETDNRRILAGRYEVGEFLGQGGMSTVYKGTDVKLGRQVAIKIMKADLAGDSDFRERFRKEAQAASRMAHSSIVRVFDAGDDVIQVGDTTQQLPFIVMEYVEGINLRQLTKDNRLSLTEASRVVESVLSALEYSHRAGIVHRDIKPANIMITRTGQVKVMDFGIARAVSETSSTVQQTTAILGTAAYFSPEQAKGETVDARTDLYSAGVVLYELLTGEVPFTGDSAVAVAYQHVSERPTLPSERNPDITPAFDRVIMHALAKDRAKRFQSAEEFSDALKLAVQGKMPKISNRAEQETILFSSGQELSDSDLALRQLTEGGGSPRNQAHPPVMWTWVAILTVVAVIAAVVFWLVNLAPAEFSPQSSRTIPTLENVQEQAAMDALRDLDLVPVPVEESHETVAAGAVIRTDPEEGAVVDVGTTVTLFVSIGPEQAEVPDLTRLSVEDATTALEELGLTVGLTSTVDDPIAPGGSVLSTSPNAGTTLASGESVDLVVSSGKVTIPDVIGQTMTAANLLLADQLRLNVRPIADPSCLQQANLPIIWQSAVGQADQRSGVDIGYCSGGAGEANTSSE